MQQNTLASKVPQTPLRSVTRLPRLWSWLKWTSIGAIVLLISYAVFVRPFIRTGAPVRGGAGGRAVPVTAEPARKADLSVRILALGTVVPLNTVTVRSRVDGQLQQISF